MAISPLFFLLSCGIEFLYTSHDSQSSDETSCLRLGIPNSHHSPPFVFSSLCIRYSALTTHSTLEVLSVISARLPNISLQYFLLPIFYSASPRNEFMVLDV
jgi:hypothetical protein